MAAIWCNFLSPPLPWLSDRVLNCSGLARFNEIVDTFKQTVGGFFISNHFFMSNPQQVNSKQMTSPFVLWKREIVSLSFLWLFVVYTDNINILLRIVGLQGGNAVWYAA